MTPLPENDTRYPGANAYTAQDYAGNIFCAYQGPNDTGHVSMTRPDGSGKIVLRMPIGSGRPCLEWNPTRSLIAVGNKETGDRALPARYPIAEYVPWPVGGTPGPQGPRGEPGAGGLTLYPAPYVAKPDPKTKIAPWSGLSSFSGSALVDVPSTFGCPVAPAYLVRLSGLATTAGVIVRAGSETAPYVLTLVTQAPNVRMDCQGWIPGPVAFVSVVGSAAVWMQIVGAG